MLISHSTSGQRSLAMNGIREDWCWVLGWRYDGAPAANRAHHFHRPCMRDIEAAWRSPSVNRSQVAAADSARRGINERLAGFPDHEVLLVVVRVRPCWS